MVSVLCIQITYQFTILGHGPLTRYVKLRVAHAPGMPGTFSPPPRVSYPDTRHGTCVTHVPWMPRSLTSGFLCSQWRGKRSRQSRRMRNPQFYVSGTRPVTMCIVHAIIVALYLVEGRNYWVYVHDQFQNQTRLFKNGITLQSERSLLATDS